MNKKYESNFRITDKCNVMRGTSLSSTVSNVPGGASVESLSISVSNCDTTRSITPPPSLPRPLQMEENEMSEE